MGDRALAPSDREYFRRGTAIMLLSVFAGFAADYGFNLTLSHVLEAHEYGDYKVAYAFAAVGSVAVLLGGDRIAPRVLSAPIARGDFRTVFPFFRFYFFIALALSFLLSIVTVTANYLQNGAVTHFHPVAFMTFVIPLIAGGALISRLLQSAKKVPLANLPWRIVLPIIKMLFVLLLVSVVTKVAIWQVIVAGAVAALIIIFWQWTHIQKHGLLGDGEGRVPLEKKQTLRLSIPMMAVMLVTIAHNHLDLFMMEFLGDEKEVGYFAAAMTTAHLLPVAQTAVAALFLPLVVPAMQRGSTEAEALFSRAQKVITAVTALLWLLLMLTGPWLLSLFGPGFERGEETLVILGTAYGLWALAAFASTWLQYADRGRMVLLASAGALMLNAACNLWLIPRYGMEGAAASTLIAMTVTATALVAMRHRYAKQPLQKGLDDGAV